MADGDSDPDADADADGSCNARLNRYTMHVLIHYPSTQALAFAPSHLNLHS